MKKYDPNNTHILVQLRGDSSTLTVSKTSGLTSFDVSLTKNKYSDKDRNLCKQDLLVFSAWKLEELANWILNAEKEKDNWDEHFSRSTNGCWLNCDCHAEWLRTEIVEFDKEDTNKSSVYITMYEVFGTNHKRYWGRKFSGEIVANYGAAKDFAGKLLECLKIEKEKL